MTRPLGPLPAAGLWRVREDNLGLKAEWRSWDLIGEDGPFQILTRSNGIENVALWISQDNSLLQRGLLETLSNVHETLVKGAYRPFRGKLIFLKHLQNGLLNDISAQVRAEGSRKRAPEDTSRNISWKRGKDHRAFLGALRPYRVVVAGDGGGGAGGRGNGEDDDGRVTVTVGGVSGDGVGGDDVGGDGVVVGGLLLPQASQCKDRSAFMFGCPKGVAFLRASLQPDKPEKFIIRGADEETLPDEILEELKTQGFPVTRVAQLKATADKRKLPIFLVQLTPSEDKDKIRNMIDLCGMKMKVEAYRTPRRPLQCHKCQRLGHVVNCCSTEKRCVKCGNNHPAKECAVKREDFSCAL
ncbi:hypothetical protein AAG570_013294 [Ranatra chinensis]|uniref:Pre-C2HC domain-containing protein n=1 Tax=Ranatra chinensis TaxID=642074 RepID=A0ABD0YGN1_9HEMI